MDEAPGVAKISSMLMAALAKKHESETDLGSVSFKWIGMFRPDSSTSRFGK